MPFDFVRGNYTLTVLTFRDEVKQAATELGKKIESEDGVENAVAAFHRKLPVVNGLWREEIWENMWYALGWHHINLPTSRTKYSDRTGTFL
jgi:hypothetical protein